MTRRRRGSAALVALFMAAVPIAYFGPLSVSGVPIVEGCSGAGPEAAGLYELVAPKIADGPLPVGMDGFFALNVFSQGMTAEEVLAALTVNVETASGDPVAGSLSVLRTRIVEGSPEFEYDQTLVGWSSTTPLDAAVELTVSASAMDYDLSSSLSIRTVTAAVDFAVPVLVGSRWRRVTEDYGTTVYCNDEDESSCGPSSFGRFTRDFYKTTITVDGSPPSVAVAWELSVTEVEGKGHFDRRAPEPTLLVYEEQQTFSPHFSDRLDEYCVNVVARDLRSGEQTSQEFCSSPEEPLDHESQDKIRYCDAPPSAELTARWCAIGANSGHPSCGSTNPAMDGGTPIGSGEEGPSIVPGVSAARAEPESMYSNDDEGGCSIAQPSRKASTTSLLAPLALLLARRRRQA